MRSIIQAIAAASAVLFCASATAPERIEYTLTPILENGALGAVQVDLRFRGDTDGETLLTLPDSWGGEQELWRSIQRLEVISGARVRDEENPAQRLLLHRPGARVHVRYRLVQDFSGEPPAGPRNRYRPIVRPQYFHLIGSTALVAPVINGATPVLLRVQRLPSGWSFASDLEHRSLVLGNTPQSVMVGGDFRVLRGADPNVRVAIRGEWSFGDADFVEEVSQIIGAARRFWGDESSPYLVTVLQQTAPDEGHISIGGTGLGDGFAFFATASAPADGITRVLAHEGLHTWIPHAIGGMSDNEAEERASYWLSEGFTDFYTARLLVREGVWAPAQFAAQLNEMLRAYAQSPVRTEPNTRIVADFWNGREVHDLPYLRGRTLALLWDARLRSATQGARDMDDVMHEMRRRARDGSNLHADQLFPLVAADVGLVLGGDIAQFVERGEVVLLPEDALAPCGRITTREVANFHRGFDIEATQANDNIVAGVDPTLPAYAAGVRNGMTLIRRDGGEIGNAELEIAYVMRDGGTERTFRYMPRGHGAFTLQQFEVDANLAGEQLAQCRRVLGGA